VTLYERFQAITDELSRGQDQATQDADSEEMPVDTHEAVRDVENVADLAETASRQILLFLGTKVTSSETTSWLAAHQAWQDAERRAEVLFQPALRNAWAGLRSSPSVSDLDDVLGQQAAGSTVAMPITALIGLMDEGSVRDGLLGGLLDDAAARAEGLAAADRARATDLLIHTLELGLVLLLASVLTALLLGRRLIRSLGVLAGHADQVSKGLLVEVEASGPREVRTVSAALGSAVRSLRRIQDQARAVARGDLSDAVLLEPLPGPLGEVVHASIEQIVESVRQRDALQSALAHQAAHDPLTELPNRAQALSLVTSALHRARRSGETTGLLFVDLDGFKAVNDVHGHACGDAVLREVARRMRQAVRPGDVVCRLGGDEFVVLVERAAGERELLDLAERLIAVVSEPIATTAQVVRIGASVGVAVSRDARTDADALVAEADTAAYRAKRRGRGRAELFDEALRIQLAARAELETALRAGLGDGELTLHYQPVVDVGDRRLVGYEALVRWQRPGAGLVPPDDFIPVAEGSNLICELDRWVLGEATRQLAAWRTGRLRAGEDADGRAEAEPTIAVNISGRHLADPRVVDDVAEALAASGLPASLLVLEVTETVLVDDPAAIGHLVALRDMGVGIAIDDFGTGYTSIGQLRSMPVDTLKIDRSFIASREPGHRELVALVIRAAHTFGLTVVAEGVEEEDQLLQLRADGCDQAQGYLLSRPLPAAEVAAFARPLAGVRPA
jgi:diguanylate cyclase (GGDEF)-like protein